MRRCFFSCAALALTALSAAGCATVENDLAREYGLRQRGLDEAVAVAAENRAPAVLTWDRAVAVMLRHNPDLRQARLDRVNAARDAQKVWTDLIPFFNLRAYRYSHFNERELRDFSATQFTGDVTLYLEKYTALPRDLYAVALSQIRADTAWRMAVKLRLLDLFDRSEALAGAQDAADRARALVDLMSRHPDYFLGKDRDAARIAARELAERVRDARDALRDLLGVGYEAVRVDPASLPDWPAAGEKLLAAGLPQEGNAGFVLDPDWVALMAVEGAGAIARRRGILRGNWPDLNAYLTLPNLSYDSRNGFSTLRFSQTQVNASLYWSPNWILDTRDQLARAKDDEGLMREAFIRRTDERLHQMANQARLLREAQTREADLTKRIEAVRQVAPKLAPARVAALLERSLHWQAERDEVRHQRRIGLAQLWFSSDNNQEVLPHAAFEKP